MKKQLKSVLLFALLLGCLAALLAFQSAASYSERPGYAEREAAYFSDLQEYIEELPGTKVVDHAVYWLPKKGTGYVVIGYFDTKEAMDSATKIVLKDEIDGIPVTSIRPGFAYDSEWDYLPPEAKGVTRIRFPKGVLSLGRYTFTCLPNLTSYKIPSTVVTLNGAFENAYGNMDHLTKISIPASVKTIWGEAFGSCSNLKKVVFKGDVEAIGDYAFGKCTSLTKITLPDSVVTLGEGAFAQSGLRSLQVPAACQKIDECAFNGCPLKYVTFRDVSHKQTVIVVTDAFRNCTGLKKVTFPANAKAVCLYTDAFKGCAALRVLVNMQPVRWIGSGAFEGCAALESVTISSRINAVGAGAFAGCAGLKKVRILAKKAAFLTAYQEDGNFLQSLPKTCRVYVKTNSMARACYDAGCPCRVTVKADLK